MNWPLSVTRFGDCSGQMEKKTKNRTKNWVEILGSSSEVP